MNNKDIKILENILENNSVEDILNEIENFSFDKQKNMELKKFHKFLSKVKSLINCCVDKFV